MGWLSKWLLEGKYKIVTQTDQYGNKRYGVYYEDFTVKGMKAIPVLDRDRVQRYAKWIDSEQVCKDFIDSELKKRRREQELEDARPKWKTTSKRKYP